MWLHEINVCVVFTVYPLNMYSYNKKELQENRVDIAEEYVCPPVYRNRHVPRERFR